MGKMALGYGSEFHLLRWLGRHRNEFDKRVKNVIEVNNVTWLDFNFGETKNTLDNELIGIEFLKNEPGFNKILDCWKNEWPQSGSSMNWDLVGYTTHNSIKTWILIEAKADFAEMKQKCQATSPRSIEKIETALANTAKNNGIRIKDDSPWTRKFYQIANRLFVLDFLKRNRINAKLINIYFVGDEIPNNQKLPKNKEEWKPKIVEMKNYLAIENSDLAMYELFLDVRK